MSRILTSKVCVCIESATQGKWVISFHYARPQCRFISHCVPRPLVRPVTITTNRRRKCSKWWSKKNTDIFTYLWPTPTRQVRHEEPTMTRWCCPRALFARTLIHRDYHFPKLHHFQRKAFQHKTKNGSPWCDTTGHLHVQRNDNTPADALLATLQLLLHQVAWIPVITVDRRGVWL